MQSSQAAEFAVGSLIILGAVVAHDDPALAWAEENWRRLLFIGLAASLLQFTVILNNGAPSARVGFARCLAAFIGGCAISAVGGAAHSAGSGVIGTTLAVILGGIGFWMLVHSTDAALNEMRTSGEMQRVVLAFLTGGVARFFVPRPEAAPPGTQKQPPSSKTDPVPLPPPATPTTTTTTTTTTATVQPPAPVDNGTPAAAVAPALVVNPKPNPATNEDERHGTAQPGQRGGGNR